MEIKVERATDADLWRRMASTQGHKVTMPWAKALKCGHSIIRATTYAVFCEGIPRYVAEHLRTHFSISPIVPEEYAWMQSKRPDRGGKDFRTECQTIVADIISALQWDETYKMSDVEDRILDLPNNFDRFAPCNFNFTVSAEGLMSLSHLRLCSKASLETRQVTQAIRDEVAKIDPDLAKHMVPQCIYRGGICPEEKCCGYNRNADVLNEYKELFE